MDNYYHKDPSIFYITENILGTEESSLEYEDQIQNFNSQLTNHCNCLLCADDCPCLQSCGLNYSVSNDEFKTKIILNEKAVKDYVIVECNDFCTCSNSCANRVVQMGPCKGLYVLNCKEKGLGLFTSQIILKGSFICEYAGEIITNREARRRDLLNRLNNKMNYIFCLNEIVGHKKIQTYIDPSLFGNIGRYINHSCDSNSFILPVRVNSPIPKLSIFSSSVIYPDTEITFDYGMNYFNETKEGMENRKICYCNSQKCRGFLPCTDF
ncbi:probable histone-lysine N-methyltransferase set-23 [Leptidea sinapis]|uniref:probable histone-lysine N-methyltransferase set-23 n=1 Tax=Leptidea sinapis TaxID=189913 RepID=UPI002141F4FD|nr:probable histone-lysine N-methyltransferase set-23 [Leptidea sinapis]XP_050673246.1 probable histone-lysine N-methyltransferase set-23 [Leptidea sinapis]